MAQFGRRSSSRRGGAAAVVVNAQGRDEARPSSPGRSRGGGADEMALVKAEVARQAAPTWTTMDAPAGFLEKTGNR